MGRFSREFIIFSSEEGIVRQSQWIHGMLLGGAATIALVQPAWAEPAKLTNVQVKPTSNGVELSLQTSAGETPQVFAVNRRDAWTADITNTRLSLPGGESFRQENPAPGIRLITVAPLDTNSVRVTVVGQGNSPTGQIQRSPGGVTFSLSPTTTAATPPGQPAATAEPAPPRLAQTQPAQPVPVPTPNLPSPFPTSQQPLVPRPDVQINGAPANPPGAPPFLPKAVAPPIGDIATGTIDASPTTIDLGSSERVRLVLKDAPAREVLSLLARTAGLNIAFTAAGGPAQPGQPQAQQQAAAAEGPRISLDVENESVQDVFNYVLRLSGLEANRVGRTIFVAPKLPNSARNLVARTVRLNQVSVTNAVGFLVALGAESAVARERQVTTVVALPVAQLQGAQAAAAPTQAQTTTETRIETQRVDYQDSTPILRGLVVSGDERTNMVTLVGDARIVSTAISQLTQLDIRRRQVVVNVRVIDLDLTNNDLANASFGFGIGRFRFNILDSSDFGLVGFGTSRGGANNDFVARLEAAIVTQNAKLLTDPTLVVQEGQTATVRLVQEVVTNFNLQTTFGQGTSQTTLTVEKGAAGLILPVRVERIDDNGFISLSVAPTVASPQGETVEVDTGTGNAIRITLLSERRLDSGLVRLRDGQTLVLSGIIQDSDRATVRKIPILGDIPLLGALFRRTDRRNERREVIVLLTPRILDDSQLSTLGYTYTPGPAVQQILDEQNRRFQPGN